VAGLCWGCCCVGSRTRGTRTGICGRRGGPQHRSCSAWRGTRRRAAPSRGPCPSGAERWPAWGGRPRTCTSGPGSRRRAAPGPCPCRQPSGSACQGSTTENPALPAIAAAAAAAAGDPGGRTMQLSSITHGEPLGPTPGKPAPLNSAEGPWGGCHRGLGRCPGWRRRGPWRRQMGSSSAPGIGARQWGPRQRQAGQWRPGAVRPKSWGVERGGRRARGRN